jgi:hypothetical protein
MLYCYCKVIREPRKLVRNRVETSIGWIGSKAGKPLATEHLKYIMLIDFILFP